VTDVRERVEMVLRVVPPARERAEWYKCSRWVQVCTSKCRKTVIHARERVRLFLRAVDARYAWVRR
jgi:hypothetical protein